MRKAILIAVFLTALGRLYAQPILTRETDTLTPWYEVADSVFANVNFTSRVPTGYLAERAFLGANAYAYRGVITDSTRVDANVFQLLYNVMETGKVLAVSDSLKNWDNVEPYFAAQQEASKIPISILAWKYGRIKTYALDSGLLDTSANGRYLIDPIPLPAENPFYTDSVFAMAPRVTYIDTEDVTFIIPASLIFENFSGSITGIEVDFDDGNGYQTVSVGVDIPVHYSTTGDKNIRYKVYFGGGILLEGNTTLFAPFFRKTGSAYLNSPYWANFTANESFAGGTAIADVSVLINCRNGGKLMKPLIIAPGFDPPEYKDFNNGVEGETFETFLNGAGGLNIAPAKTLKDFLDAEGYDLVYINYHDGGTYIQRNAKLVKSVIQEVNAQKLANGSTEPTAVVGISMGGLVARWALLEMENASQMHDVEKFISYDVPHNGANIPLASQHMTMHLANSAIRLGFIRVVKFKKIVRELELAENVLTCFAAQQMLMHHAYSTSGEVATSFRNTMMSFFESEGFPTQVSSRGVQIKNTAILNGSDNATDQGIGNSSTIMTIKTNAKMVLPNDYKFIVNLGLANFTADAHLWTMPDAIQGQKRIYRGRYTALIGILFPVVFSSEKVNITNGNGIDNVPGAFQDINNNLQGADPNAIPGLTISNPLFNFLPSVSSAALVSPFRNNLNYNISSNFNTTTKTWLNSESPMKDIVSDVNALSISQNTSHTAWYTRSANFIINNIIPIQNGSVANVASPFNYGGATTNLLPLNLIIPIGGEIKVNNDVRVGFNPSTNSNPFPVTGSTFKVFSPIGDGCGTGAKVTIKDLAFLKVGDNSVGNKGELFMREGSTLEIEDGGLLIIHNNSKVVIEEGAELIYNDGAQIVLEGENAVLELKGKLTLKSGSNFTFSKGSASIGGFIKTGFTGAGSGIFAEGTTATISFSGNNSPGLYVDKVLEIAEGDFITPDPTFSASNYLDQFTIYNGGVTLGADSKLKVSVDYDVSYTYFTGISKNTNIGLDLPNPSLGTVSRCRFSNLNIGMQLDADNISSLYTIGYSTFSGNTFGIVTDGGGPVKIVNSNFYSNGRGVFAIDHTDQLEINLCNISSNTDYGVVVESASSSSYLYLYSVNLENNATGIDVSNNGNVTAQCSWFKDNGIGMNVIGLVNLSPNKTVNSKTGGDNVFDDNTTSGINISGSIYLEDGTNTFKRGVGNSAYYIVGGLTNCNPCDFKNTSHEVYAANNYWNPGPSANYLPNGSGSLYSVVVNTFPHPTTATLIGNVYTSINSYCFSESGGNVSRNYSWTAPFSKTDIDPTQTVVEDTPEKINIYPNPATSKVFIQTASKDLKNYEIKAFDLTGREVISANTTGSNFEKLEISTETLSGGTYLLSIRTNDGSINEIHRLVIIK